jgi:hypothetical protein
MQYYPSGPLLLPPKVPVSSSLKLPAGDEVRRKTDWIKNFQTATWSTSLSACDKAKSQGTGLDPEQSGSTSYTSYIQVIYKQ